MSEIAVNIDNIQGAPELKGTSLRVRRSGMNYPIVSGGYLAGQKNIPRPFPKVREWPILRNIAKLPSTASAGLSGPERTILPMRAQKVWSFPILTALSVRKKAIVPEVYGKAKVQLIPEKPGWARVECLRCHHVWEERWPLGSVASGKTQLVCPYCREILISI